MTNAIKSFKNKTPKNTVYRVGGDIVNEKMRAVAISDCHFGKNIAITSSVPIFIKNIQKIILKEKATVLFILGDITHINCGDAQTYAYLFENLNQFGIPIFAISGNHDRSISTKYAKIMPKYSNVHMVTSDLLIKLTHPNPKPGEISNLYMTHDLGEPLRLTRTQCKSYMLALKQVNSNVIGAEDYLLTGHTHECVEVPDERCSCLKPMSVDLNFFGYALITAENGFVVQHFDDARLH